MINQPDPRQKQTKSLQNLQLRARIIHAIREFFLSENYLEVETPHRIPAPAPETHIDAPVSGSWFLHTSPELCMKRLLSAGTPRIFQICRCFREKERGDKHLPEFTLIEWYSAGCDYTHMMSQCEKLIRFTASRTGFGNSIPYQGNRIDLSMPWHRLSVKDAFRKYTSTTLAEAICMNHFDELMGCEIEPELGRDRPVFLYDYPASCGALARLKPENKQVTERFELYMAGLELCNAFTELTNPKEQRQRFEAALKERKSAGKTEYPMPEKFLKDLETMPEAAGNALGIDRLVMLFANTTSIDEVVTFTPEEL